MSISTNTQLTESPEYEKIARKIESSWILFVTDTLLENSGFSIISLPHPATGDITKYCLDDIHKKIYEIITFNEPYRSWFIGETVKSDGSIQILSHINPLFIILPRLRFQCTNKAVPLQDLLCEKGFDKIIHFISDLDRIADLKGPPDMKAYKYNEEKTLSWLEDKVKKLANVLRQKSIHVTTGSTSSTFVSSNITNDDIDEELYIKYAHELVSEYLQADLMECLEKRFNFQPNTVETLSKKRKSEIDHKTNSAHKKIKPATNNNEETENVICTPSIDWCDINKKPLSAKEKARQKAASGTKNISSFFKNVSK